MSTSIVAIIEKSEIPTTTAYGRQSTGPMVITESMPVKRSIHFRLMSSVAQGGIADGYHFLTLPFVQMAIGVESLPPTFNWNNHIRVFGSMEPFSGVDQPLFALPMPNTDLTGRITCTGAMRASGVKAEDIGKLVAEVITAYWTSTFAYWASTFPSGNNFKALQGGITTLKTLVPTLRLAQFYPGTPTYYDQFTI